MMTDEMKRDLRKAMVVGFAILAIAGEIPFLIYWTLVQPTGWFQLVGVTVVVMTVVCYFAIFYMVKKKMGI